MTANTVAANLAAAITANCDTYIARRIDYATWDAEQMRLWKDAARLGVASQVIRLVAPTCEPPTVTAEQIEQVAIGHAYQQAEKAIAHGDWPHVCPYCTVSFQAADRWFPYCGPECAIDAENDR